MMVLHRHAHVLFTRYDAQDIMDIKPSIDGNGMASGPITSAASVGIDFI
jgi:hypothetical protein